MQLNNTPVQSDDTARETAVSETTKNIIVEAGAGTGKTTLLTDRLCHLILAKGIAIDKIIALTFTEKAAAEIKTRLLAKMTDLLSVLKDEYTTETEAQKKKFEFLNKLKNNILEERKKTCKEELAQEELEEKLKQDIEQNFELAERAMISTIHGFCFKILKRFPAEAGLSPDVKAESDQAETALKDKLWAAFLERELEDHSQSGNNTLIQRDKKWLYLLENFSLEEIKSFALDFADSKIKNYNPMEKAPEIGEFLLKKAAEGQKLLDIYKNPKKLSSFENNLQRAIEALKKAAEYHNNIDIEGNIEDEPFLSKGSLQITKNWTDEEDFEKAFAIVKLAENLSFKNLVLLNTAKELVADYAKEVKEALNKAGFISFDEMIIKTRDLVKNNRQVRQELKEEYKSILLDEFQDTDPAQGEIFLYLSEQEDKHATDWKDIKLKQGKLFIVGDPKQSIYRFRGADIAAYDEFTDMLQKQNAEKCFLQKNFRSSENIVAYANKFGEKCFEKQKNVQPPYVPITHTKDYAPQPIQLIISGEGKDVNIDEIRKFHSQIIISWIKENVGKTKLSSGQTLKYKDITVLYPTGTHADILIDSLKEAGIPYSVEENKNFYEAQEIKDLFNLLRLTQNPKDKIALTGALRSPFCLVKDQDIWELSQNNKLRIDAETENPYLRAQLKKLRELCRRAEELSPTELINYIFFETNFREMEIFCSLKEQTAANIDKFMEIANRLADTGINTLPQMLYHLEYYFKKEEKEGESPLTEESLDSVKLMTVHKSKGLQAPAVILFDIAKKKNSGGNSKDKKNSLSDWKTGKSALFLGKAKPAAYKLLELQKKTHENAEKLRLLYVALTRAEEKLLIVSTEEIQGLFLNALLKADCYPDKGNQPAALLNNKVKITYIPYNKETGISAAAPKITEKQTFDFPSWRKTWLARNEDYQRTLREKEISPSGANLSAVMSEDQEKAMLIGRLCHKFLAQLLQNELLNARKAALAEGLSPEQCEEETAEAEKIIKEFAKSNAFKELSRKKFLASELPFSMKDEQNGSYINGIIDAVFEDEQGNIFIAEFKSDKINKEQIQERAQKYSAQLDIYLKAAGLLFPAKKITGGIIFLRPKEIYALGEK